MEKRPTFEMLRAVVAYADEHGRTWKADLSLDWYHARRPGALQALRNDFGPTWLDKVKLADLRARLEVLEALAASGREG